MRPVSSLLLAAITLVLLIPAGSARAEATAPEATPAQLALSTYLDAVKAKKWDVAKKSLHPRTFEKIAEIKKRTGLETHGLAPWARVKQSYLSRFELTDAAPSAREAVVVRTSEEHFSVEDGGVEEGVQVEYLLIPAGGRWFVSDRRLGEGQFKESAVEAGYRGWFDGEFPLPGEPGTKAKSGQKRK
jgi:hypothetical protein